MSVRDTWHRLVKRLGIYLAPNAHNPGNDTTLWARYPDQVLMFGDDPVGGGDPPEPVVTTLSNVEQVGGVLELDAATNPLGFYVTRDQSTNLAFVNFPVGETRLVAFQGEWGIKGTAGVDPAHEYFWEGGTAPADGVAAYQIVRFTKVTATDILCMAALELAIDPDGSLI
jgi:hypothetical protein